MSGKTLLQGSAKRLAPAALAPFSLSLSLEPSISLSSRHCCISVAASLVQTTLSFARPPSKVAKGPMAAPADTDGSLPTAAKGFDDGASTPPASPSPPSLPPLPAAVYFASPTRGPWYMAEQAHQHDTPAMVWRDRKREGEMG
jgi:hypothetical protein